MASSPVKRYRYGDTLPVKAPFPLGTVINEGDFIYLDTVNVTPPDTIAQLQVQTAAQFPLGTAIADPTTAPTISANAAPLGPGFTVASTGFKVAYTFVTKDGLETGPSALSTAMNTSGNGINVQLPAITLPANVAAVNWYTTTDGGGAGTLTLTATTYDGYGLVLSIPPATSAPAPPAASALSQTVMTQVAFAKAFVGVSSQTYLGENPLTTYGVKDQYIKILTAGTYDFACLSANWNVGDLVGIALTGSAVNPQLVVSVPQSQYACAIARCVQGAKSSTTVRAALFGTKRLVAHQF